MNIETMLRLSYYREVADVNRSRPVKLVQHVETGAFYVRKALEVYDTAVYEHLARNPIRGIPRIVETVEDGGTLYVIEEYISGATLAELLARGAMRPREAADVVAQLCDILRPLHEHRPPIVHRDIKPENLILKEDGALFLLDFNAAKESDGGARDTVLIGTVGYAAPEQYGFGVSVPATDIYAVGVLLRALLTGDPGRTPCAGELAKVIEKCTQIDPGRRYQSVEALKTAVLRAAKPERTRAQSWLPPGLGNRRQWVVLIAACWYAFFGWFSLTFTAKGAESAGDIWLNRIAAFALFLSLTLFLGNYRGIWEKLPLSRSRLVPVKIIGVLLYAAVIFVSVFTVLGILENTFFR